MLTLAGIRWAPAEALSLANTSTATDVVPSVSVQSSTALGTVTLGTQRSSSASTTSGPRRAEAFRCLPVACRKERPGRPDKRRQRLREESQLMRSTSAREKADEVAILDR